MNGWSVEAYDICWLDCAEHGRRKVWHGKEIVLCAPHAAVLEEGKIGRTYRGAPLPPDVEATEWPWRSLETELVSVV